MRFSGDDRAVVIQIGAVLLLAAIVIAMTGYQAAVVPDQNKEVEYNHNQEVQNQLQDLRNGIVSTTGGSEGSSHSVTLGTTYPPRTLFVNPGPPSGQLRTLGTHQILIENATATGGESRSVREYWNGTDRTINTTAFAYTPNYNEFSDAPTTIYEHSLLYNAHPTGAETTVTDQVLVDGDRITLVTLAGTVQESSSGTASVNVRTASAATSSVSVTDDGDPIRITVPTRSPEVWTRALPDDARVVDNTSTGGDYVLSTIELDPGTYELRMARARVGDAGSGPSPDTDAEYVVEVDDGGPVADGESTTVVAEVRNRHNNLVRNATVQYDIVGGGDGTKPTGSDGRVEIDAQGGDNVTAWIRASDYDGAEPYERVAIEVPTSGGGGGGGGGAYSVNWRDPDADNPSGPLSSCDAERCTWDLGADGDDELDLRAALSDSIGGMTVEFGVNDTSVGTVSPGSESTDSNGEAVTTFSGAANGTVAVYAASGGSSDRIAVKIVNASGGSTNSPPTADFTYSCTETECTFNSTSTDSDGTIERYEWDFESDGNVDATGQNVTHTYPSAGTYDVTHTVTDNDSATASETKQVSVTGSVVISTTGTSSGGSKNKNSVVTVSISNNRAQYVDVTDVTINSTNTQAVELDNHALTGTDGEVEVDVGQDNSVDASADAASYTIGSRMTLDTSATVSTDGSADITFNEFDRDGTNNKVNPIEMSGQTVTVTVHYTHDGTNYTVTETVSV